MQKQRVMQKMSILATVSMLSFGLGQAFAAAPAKLGLTADRPTIELSPTDPGSLIHLSVLDSMGNPTTTTRDVTVSVTSGGVFGNHTLSTTLPKNFSKGSFPVGGKEGFYKPIGVGKATLQAEITSLDLISSNVLEMNVVAAATGDAECDGLEIDDTDLNVGTSSDPNTRAKVVGGTSVDGGKAQCDGSQVQPGQQAHTKFKLRVAPQHVGRGGKTFLLLYIVKPGQDQGRFFDLGSFQYVDLRPSVIGTLGAWGGLGRAGNFDQLPQEIDLFDFDTQTQMMFYGNKFVDFNFPSGTTLMWIGGYTLRGTNKSYFGMTSLVIK